MSSSSSDDEELRIQFKEAVSEELIKHMEADEEDRSSKKETVVNIKSKRNDPEAIEDSQFEIKSTPQFRMHVAKKLTAYLDRILDTDHLQPTSTPEEDDSSNGIRLMKRSVNVLQSPDDAGTTLKKKKKCDTSDSEKSSDEEEISRLSSVCVTGNCILDGGEGAFKKKTMANVINNSKKSKVNR